jgi:two-component system phosphate regulon sensor histidine kinase PhoR
MFRRIAIPFLLIVLALTGATELAVGTVIGGPSRRQMALLVGCCGLLACAAVVAASTALSRRPGKALTDLADAASRVGSTDDPPRVPVSDIAEAADAGRAFNAMSARIAARIAELEEDRHQLRAILSGMVEGVVALDAEQRVLYANERASQLLEFAAPAPVGRRFWEVVRQRELLDVVRRALEGPEPTREEIAWSGATPRSLTVHAARLAGPPPRGAVLVLHDTSDLRRLERLRQEFVANVSHELKTPLSVIKACVETLQEGAAEDAGARVLFLQRIAEQADRLHLLILDLLGLARIEAGVEVFEFRELPVAAVVAECLERHRTRAAARKQSLAAATTSNSDAGDPQGLHVWADPEALDQILDNLVDNALKYTPEGGQVSVSWNEADGQVCLEITDTGIGIPSADLARIFERFYRVDKARSREVGGTGLGLSIVKHLAQAMHGSVRATSTLGQGSTFFVCLPKAVV